MQARLSLQKEECLTLLQGWYENLYQVPVKVTPVFPQLTNGNQPTVFFRMNDSMVDEQGFLTVLNQTLEQAGFIVNWSSIYVDTEDKLEFQELTIIIQSVADTNLNVLPEFLRKRIEDSQFCDRICICKVKK